MNGWLWDVDGWQWVGSGVRGCNCYSCGVEWAEGSC